MIVYTDYVDRDWNGHWATSNDLDGLWIRVKDGTLNQIAGTSQKRFKSVDHFQRWCKQAKEEYLSEYPPVE